MTATVKVIQRKWPRQPRAVTTVDSVLEAATHILSEVGLAGFNTNAVARRARVSIGSLYQYFPNNEAITTALILRAHHEIVAGLRRIVMETEGLPVKLAITAMVRMLIAGLPRQPRVQRVPRFFWAPAACWWALTTVLSIISASRSRSVPNWADTRCQTPLLHQRLKRVYVVCQPPHSAGKSRQGEPVRAIHSTAIARLTR